MGMEQSANAPEANLWPDSGPSLLEAGTSLLSSWTGRSHTQVPARTPRYNETSFRDLNERKARWIANGLASVGFRCECADVNCSVR